jgi:CBS domain-containing protein
MSAMNVWKVCNQRAITVSEHAQLSEVARLMENEHVGAVIVVDSARARPAVVGIVTDRDIVCAQLDRTLDLSQLTAGEAMTRDPLVLLQEGSVDSAIEHMRVRGVRRAPVVTTSGVPVGMLSTDDLLVHISLKVSGMAALVARQVRAEK